MRLAPRTEVRVIPDLLHGRDEHLKRDTEFPAVRGKRVQAWRALHAEFGALGARQEPGGCKAFEQQPSRRRWRCRYRTNPALACRRSPRLLSAAE